MARRKMSESKSWKFRSSWRGRKESWNDGSVKWISRTFPTDIFYLSLLAEILQRLLLPHLDRHRKRQKRTEGEASTPFPASTTTSEGTNNI
ncbi:unnamed protein product [Caenorhabditis nigoni]